MNSAHAIPFRLTRPLRRGLFVLLGVLGLGLPGGCAHLRPASVPIPTVRYPASETGQTDTLVVFLPGRGGSMYDFEKHGFIDEMRRTGITADAIAVDAHLGYYYRRNIVDRLSADVFRPARAKGYRRIVVAGISLGGLGAVLCSRDLPAQVDELVLLSPFLGDDENLFQQIRGAGGPRAWAKGRIAQSGNVGSEIWTYLGQHSDDLPPTWLLYGTKDYLRAGQQELSALLPRPHVFVIEGAHNWSTWQRLWRLACESPGVFADEKAAGRETRH